MTRKQLQGDKTVKKAGRKAQKESAVASPARPARKSGRPAVTASKKKSAAASDKKAAPALGKKSGVKSRTPKIKEEKIPSKKKRTAVPGKKAGPDKSPEIKPVKSPKRKAPGEVVDQPSLRKTPPREKTAALSTKRPVKAKIAKTGRDSKKAAKSKKTAKIGGISTRTGKARLKRTSPAKVPAQKEGTPFLALPREYGEDELLVMVVDPNVMYAVWEITKDTLPREKGDLTMRIFDVTETKGSADAYSSFIDIRIGERVGSDFFDVRMPGREVVVEMGLLSRGSKFIPLLRSPVVTFPILLAFDELGIVRKLFEAGVPVGY